MTNTSATVSRKRSSTPWPRSTGLKVIARTSAFAFKGKNEDIRRIAETLGVTLVLEGSVRRAGGRLRVTAQLIDAADGAHRWSQRYDRRCPTSSLSRTTSRPRSPRAQGQAAEHASPGHYTPRLSAYESLLRGRVHLTSSLRIRSIGRRAFSSTRSRSTRQSAVPHVERAGTFHLRHARDLAQREVVPYVREEVDRAQRSLRSDLGLRFCRRPSHWFTRLRPGGGGDAFRGDDERRQMFRRNASGYTRASTCAGRGASRNQPTRWRARSRQDPLNPTWHAI